MRKRIIAGNWKMYKTVEEAKQFMTQIHNQLPDTSQVESVICAPALHLTQLVEMTDDSPLSIGAQTMHSEKEGAFTGEISPYMLQTAGVQYVIIGHSERRLYFHETDEVVNQKVQAAFAYNLIPIICVGESLEEREAGRTFQRVTAQVKQALLNVGRTDAARAIIAYEPIWAIGTGKTATANDANEVCGEIRRMLTTMYDAETAERVRIQYGGSVKPSNIAELLAKPHIDGALVGGASLDPASFLQIVEAGTDAK